MRGTDDAGQARRWRDPAAFLSYLSLALLVLIGLWRDPQGRILARNRDDHGFFLFAMAHGERVIFHAANPLFSDRLNAPRGVNMMANTSVLALSLPLSPVTHFLGAGVSVALMLTLGLAGTAIAWYWVLSRHLVHGRAAAWIGGLWCGFAPAMVAHANGHVNFVAQFVVPFIVWQVLRLRERGRVVRGGVALALLVVLQVFINEEVLLFTALTVGVFLVVWGLLEPEQARAAARPFAAGLAVATGVALALLAYPLWFQFAGPGSYRGQPFPPGQYVTDLLAVGAFPRQSLAGNDAIAQALSASPTEDNAFFGVPALVMLVVAMAMLWRSAAGRATAAAGLVLLVMSMGARLQVGGRDTSIPLPFDLVSHVPLIDLVSVTRFAMASATVIGVLLALAADRAAALPHRRRLAFRVALALALLPVAPKPLPTIPADPLPPFIAAGMWRSYVPAGRSLVPVPLPDVRTGRTGMRWAALSGLGFRVPRGYFLGPAKPPADMTGSWSAPGQYTSHLLGRVGESGVVPPLAALNGHQVLADLAYWRAAVVVLVPGSRHGQALRAVLTEALGQAPRLIGGVWVWNMHAPRRP